MILVSIESVRYLLSYNYSLRRAKFLYSPSVCFIRNRLLVTTDQNNVNEYNDM